MLVRPQRFFPSDKLLSLSPAPPPVPLSSPPHETIQEREREREPVKDPLPRIKAKGRPFHSSTNPRPTLPVNVLTVGVTSASPTLDLAILPSDLVFDFIRLLSSLGSKTTARSTLRYGRQPLRGLPIIQSQLEPTHRLSHFHDLQPRPHLRQDGNEAPGVPLGPSR